MTELPKTAARQGTTLGRMRYVLVISTVLAAIALGLLLLGWIA
ncbi:MAG TPA: hypothetical protein VMV26_15380 [Alphaproteobacteria bacterium]|nr:hypothetical protein [Alphaproteobacteria bacterium]